MAASAPEVGPMMAKVALECGGDISASQEDILANSSFLGAGNAPSASASASQAREDEDEEEFATPPELPQQDPITMCSLPFTPTPTATPSQPQSPSPPPSDDDDAAAKPRRKPRVCTRKVRGAKISTPSPTPTPSPKQQQQPEQPPHAAVDPLYRAVLMIPTATTTTTSKQDPLEEFLALAASAASSSHTHNHCRQGRILRLDLQCHRAALEHDTFCHSMMLPSNGQSLVAPFP